MTQYEYIMEASKYEAWAKQARKRLPAWCGLEPEDIMVFREGDHVSIIGIGENQVIADAYIEAIRDDGFEVIKKAL